MCWQSLSVVQDARLFNLFTTEGENSLGACAVAFETDQRERRACARNKAKSQKPCNMPKACDPSVRQLSATVQMRPPGAVPGRHAKTVRGCTARRPLGQPESYLVLVRLLVCPHDLSERVLSQSNEVTDQQVKRACARSVGFISQMHFVLTIEVLLSHP